MMRPDEYAAVATQVRRAWDLLSLVSERLLSSNAIGLAEQLFDVEIELARTHKQLVKLSLDPRPAPAQEQLFDPAGDSLPF